MLSALDSLQPPGTYRMVVDEERIAGLTFVAYRRTSTTLHFPAMEVSAFPRAVIHVDPEELAAVISADIVSQSKYEKTQGS